MICLEKSVSLAFKKLKISSPPGGIKMVVKNKVSIPSRHTKESRTKHVKKEQRASVSSMFSD